MFEQKISNLSEAAQEKLRQAEAQAADVSVAERRDEEESKLLNRFLNGEITLTEYHALDRSNDELSPGEVAVSNENELLHSLIFLLHDEALARELTEHEVDHYREAIRLGFVDSRYIIRFFTNDGCISLRAAITLVLPKQGDEDQIRQHIRIIIGAPHELSDLDLMQINPK